MQLLLYFPVGCRLYGLGLIFHHCGNVAGDAEANKIFACAGRRHCTGGIISKCAGTYYRGVADAAVHFVGQPAGRRARRQITVFVQGDGSDRSKSIVGLFRCGVGNAECGIAILEIHL